MTTKYIGKESAVVAYDALDVNAKCVVSPESKLVETYIVTALPIIMKQNNVENNWCKFLPIK